MPPSSKQDVREASRAGPSSVRKPANPRRPLRKQLLRSVVKVKVGPEGAQEEFQPHAELLSYYSPFFKSMMSGNWVEAQTGIINLSADDPEVFEVFQNWLYGHDLGLVGDQVEDTSLILSLWVFGDKIQVPDFQNAAIEALRSAVVPPLPHTRTFRLQDIQTAFEHTGEGSPLRKFIVDLYVWDGPLTGLMVKLLEEDYPKAFIIQLFDAYTNTFQRPKNIKDRRPYGANAEQYHVRYPGSSVGQEAGTDKVEA
ncbi:MAG: hypothetical protein Q9224_000986 [Gallowayella concinna]